MQPLVLMTKLVDFMIELYRILPMKHKSYSEMNCSLAQTLEAVGERWSLLILRDAFYGVKRFGHFQRRLGIARNILTSRLNRLIEEGVLERRESEEGAYSEYFLTEQGLALQPALIALTQWGDKYRPNPKGDRWIFVERATQQAIQPMTVRSDSDQVLKPREIKAVAGPALSDD